MHGDGRDLELRAHGERVHAEIRRISGGVVISRRAVDVETWLRALAEEMRAVSARDAGARAALAKFLRL